MLHVQPGASSATKSLGRILQHVADIGDTGLHVQPHSTSVAEQLLGCQVTSAIRKSQVTLKTSYLDTYQTSTQDYE